nr:Gfo/Idh/MocA family oxidoreductase [Nitrospirillum iridis]
MLDSGFLGKPFGGTCIFNLGLFNQPHPRFPYNWFAEAGHGVSALRNLGSHALHMLVHLFGEVAEVMADDRRLLSEWRFPDGSVVQPQTNDFANLTLRFRTGMVMQLQVSWSATVGRGWHLEAFGSGGRLVMAAPTFPNSSDTTLHAGVLGSRVLEPVEIPARLMWPDGIHVDPEAQPQAVHGMSIAMRHMRDTILGGGRGAGGAGPDFGQAWAVERILEAARLSSIEGWWIPLDEIC